MKKVFLALVAALALSTAADAANIPLQTGPNDPALDLYYNNQTIQSYNAGVNGNLAELLASAATTLTTIQPLLSYVMPGGQLNAAGQAIHVKAWGVNSADANVKTVTFAYGAATCALVVTGSANTWIADFYVVKTAAAAQITECDGKTGTTNVASVQGTGTNTDTAATTILVQGTAATAGTITLVGAYVEQLK